MSARPLALVRSFPALCPKPTYQGWAWLTRYVLDSRGMAVDKREIFVRLVNLRPAQCLVR
ncbi:hypothetical protein E1182_11075 [Micromonospora sp. KC721]|nr:hypothetical protein [Micromonospora sp. KC721]TDB79853.1 hypothetical protein E1182_11075 [Micromonospora sp. KC721]